MIINLLVTSMIYRQITYLSIHLGNKNTKWSKNIETLQHNLKFEIFKLEINQNQKLVDFSICH